MASSSQAPLPPSRSTSALLRENLNRCNSTGSTGSNRSKISTGGAGVCLFDSSKLRNIKANILQEISSKWEATFSDQSGTTALAAGTTNNKSLFNDKSPSGNIISTSPMSTVNRKHKMRSVYGQPEVEQTVCNNNNSSSGLQSGKQWSSLDSLDTYDSGNGGMGSTSTSCSDLRDRADSQQQCNKGDAMISTKSPVAVCSSDLATSVESSDNEQEFQKGYGKKHVRCPSSNSTSSSGCSIDSQSEVDEMSREAKIFMRNFVRKIFSNSSSISLEEKASFGQFARSESGRVWFGRYITKERNENKRVSESTFYSLAQYFAIVLFECADADHFTPAKSLMNMCFTYYHQPASRPWSGGSNRNGNGAATNHSSSNNNNANSSSNNKQYLSSVLRDQPIWRSLRFWNAAFFDAVQAERVTFFESSRSADHHHRPPSSVMISSLQQDALDDWQFQANVTFGQLGTFTYQMHSFGLPKGLCLEFLRKQSTIANLTSEQIHLLIENIDMMYKNGVV